MLPGISPTLAAEEPVKTGNTASFRKSASGDSLKSAKVQEAIEKFEGLFMSMMIKQLRETSSGDGFFPGDSSDTYGGMFDMFMGDHLATSSDIGLEKLFSSSAAMSQLEDYVAPQITTGQRSKGIEEYRNEQFRSGAVATPSVP
jgi:Rod binding domain-containing protein